MYRVFLSASAPLVTARRCPDIDDRSGDPAFVWSRLLLEKTDFYFAADSESAANGSTDGHDGAVSQQAGVCGRVGMS